MQPSTLSLLCICDTSQTTIENNVDVQAHFPMCQPEVAYPVEKASSSDEDDVMEFLLSDFILREPMNEALGLKADDSRDFFRYLVRKGLKSNVSCLMRDENKKVIAVKLCSFLYRNQAESSSSGNNNNNNSQNEAEEEPPTNVEVGKIGTLLQRLDENIWKTVPEDVNKLYYIIIISVSANFGRRGLAKKLMDYGLDEARELQCQGMLAEATAYNSQQMFAKMNFDVLAEIKHSDYCDEQGKQHIKCLDKTESAQLVFKRI